MAIEFIKISTLEDPTSEELDGEEQYFDYLRLDAIAKLSKPMRGSDGVWIVRMYASGSVCPRFRSKQEAVDFYNDVKSKLGII